MVVDVEFVLQIQNTATQSGARAYQVTSSNAGYGGYTAPPPAPAPALGPTPAPSVADVNYQQFSTCRAAGWTTATDGHTKYIDWWTATVKNGAITPIDEFADLTQTYQCFPSAALYNSDEYIQACYHYHANAVGAEKKISL